MLYEKMEKLKNNEIQFRQHLISMKQYKHEFINQ